MLHNRKIPFARLLTRTGARTVNVNVSSLTNLFNYNREKHFGPTDLHGVSQSMSMTLLLILPLATLVINFLSQVGIFVVPASGQTELNAFPFGACRLSDLSDIYGNFDNISRSQTGLVLTLF